MATFLLLATENGVVVCEREGQGWQEARRSLEDQRVTSLLAQGGAVLAGTRHGLYRSEDAGASWQEASAGLSIRLVRWLAGHPEIPARCFAGTEPAGIFVSDDGGRAWRGCPEVIELRELHGWSLPYSPEAGCVRGFAFLGTRGYAAVEDGCVLVSNDSGATWQLAAGSRGRADHRPAGVFIHSDVHSIEVHPASPDLVAAPTGGGFYTSADGGMTWNLIYPHSYTRAVWLDSQDVNHLVLGPADGVDFNGRIEQTRDGGRTWEAASGGLAVPWRRHMVERFCQAGDQLLAVLSNGELLASYLDELDWHALLPQVQGVNAVAVLET
jgi:photosystem II stability/assembly factor-like uncharacterized protein